VGRLRARRSLSGILQSHPLHAHPERGWSTHRRLGGDPAWPSIAWSLYIIAYTALAERYSEHPLAEAVRALAHDEHITLIEPKDFEAVPGHGVRAFIDSHHVAVGNRRLIPSAGSLSIAADLEAQGKALLFMEHDDNKRIKQRNVFESFRCLIYPCVYGIQFDNTFTIKSGFAGSFVLR